MFVFLGFCGKDGEEFSLHIIRHKYCKILDTSDGVVEIYSEIYIDTLIREKNIHILFWNTELGRYTCDRQGYDEQSRNYVSPRGKQFLYNNLNLIYESCNDNYYCFRYNCNLAKSIRDYNLVFSYNDIKVLCQHLNLEFTYIESNIISAITSRISHFLNKIKLSTKFKHQVYLEEKDCFDIDYSYPFTSLCLYVCESKDDLERLYNLFSTNLTESFIFKIKKWYRVYSDYSLNKVDSMKSDNTASISFNSVGYGSKIERLKKFNNSKNYASGNNFYALELWYSTKMIYKKKFPKYYLSDLINNKIK